MKWKTLGLSGTPIENNLLDLKSDEINSKRKFGNIENYDIEVKALSRTFILRRDKVQVLKDLPSSKENIIRINLCTAKEAVFRGKKK